MGRRVSWILLAEVGDMRTQSPLLQNVFLNCPVARSFWRRIQALAYVVMGHPEYRSLPIGKESASLSN